MDNKNFVAHEDATFVAGAQATEGASQVSAASLEICLDILIKCSFTFERFGWIRIQILPLKA